MQHNNDSGVLVENLTVFMHSQAPRIHRVDEMLVFFHAHTLPKGHELATEQDWSKSMQPYSFFTPRNVVLRHCAIS